MKGIHIIKGNPSVGAGLIAAKIKSCRPRYDYRVIRLTPEICELQAFEDGLKSGIVTFTAEEARIAGTQNMGKFPKNMLFARCISNLHRFYLPDLFNGAQVYTPEEFGAEIDDQGRLVDIEQESDPGYDNRPSYTPPVTKPVVAKPTVTREGFITEAQGKELWALVDNYKLEFDTVRDLISVVQGVLPTDVRTANIKSTEYEQIFSQINNVGREAVEAAKLEAEPIANAENGLDSTDNHVYREPNTEAIIPGLPEPTVDMTQIDTEELEALGLDSESEEPSEPEDIEF
jgi:hypothetical protein